MRTVPFLLQRGWSGPTGRADGDVKILLVEDDSSCRTATEILLKHLGYGVQAVASAEEALMLFDRAVHHVVLTDIRLPGLSGEDLAVELKRRSPSVSVIVYTGSAEVSIESVDAVLSKPASIEAFRETLPRLTHDRASPLKSTASALL